MEGIKCSKLVTREGISRDDVWNLCIRMRARSQPRLLCGSGTLTRLELGRVFRFFGLSIFNQHFADRLSVNQLFGLRELTHRAQWNKMLEGLTNLSKDLRTLYSWSCSLKLMDRPLFDLCLKEKPAALLIRRCPVWSRWVQRETGRYFFVEAVTSTKPARFECTDGAIELPPLVGHYSDPLVRDLKFEGEDPLPLSCSVWSLVRLWDVLEKAVYFKPVPIGKLVEVYSVADFLNVTPILDLAEEQFRSHPYRLVNAVESGKINPLQAPPYASDVFLGLFDMEELSFQRVLKLAERGSDRWLLRQVFTMRRDSHRLSREFVKWAGAGERPPRRRTDPFGVEVREICREWPGGIISKIARVGEPLHLIGLLWNLGGDLNDPSLQTFALWEWACQYQKSPESVPKAQQKRVCSLSFDQTAREVAPWLRRHPMLPLRLADQGLLKDLTPLDGALAAAFREKPSDSWNNGLAHRIAIQFDLPLTQRCLMRFPLRYPRSTPGTASFKRDAAFIQTIFKRHEFLDENGVRGQLTRKVASALVGPMVEGAIKKKGNQFFNFLYDLGWKRSTRPELKDLVYFVVRFQPEHASGLLSFTWPFDIRQVRDRAHPFHLTHEAFERVAPYLQYAPDLVLRAAEEKVIPSATGCLFYWNCDNRKKGFDETLRLARLVESTVARPHTQPIAEMVQQIRRDLVKNCDDMGPLKQVWAFAKDVDDLEVKQVCQFFAVEFLRLRRFVEELPRDLVSSVGAPAEFSYGQVRNLYGVQRYFFENPDCYAELVKMKRVRPSAGFVKGWDRLSKFGQRKRAAFFFKHLECDGRLQEEPEQFLRALFWGHFETVPKYAKGVLQKHSVDKLLSFYCRPSARTPLAALRVVRGILIEKLDEDSCDQILQDAVKYHKYELIEACREFVHAEPGRLERIWPVGVPEWLEKYLD